MGRKPNNQHNSRGRRSLTRKGRHTRSSLLEAALDVFRQQGYYGASVAEISRRAGLSQGSFYQYFQNKEQIFLELNDNILAGFWAKAGALDWPRLPEEGRLTRVVDLILEHCRANYHYHRLLGEFEVIDPVTIGYYDSMARYLRGFFRHEINEGRLKAVDPNVIAYALIGLASFQAMDWRPEGELYCRGDLADMATRLLLRGLGAGNEWQPSMETAFPAPPLIEDPGGTATAGLTQGQATARALLFAAEKVFGRSGFNRAGIAEITREAGVAQGTFYVHFKSKRDLMEGSVRDLSRQMRLELKRSTAGITDRREVERIGYIAFFRFLKQHRQIYRIVAESETMGREMAVWYYKRLAAGWEPGLAEGMSRGEIRDDLPAAFMVRSIMGVVHMIGLKWLVWNSSPQAELPRQVLEDTIALTISGLAPR